MSKESTKKRKEKKVRIVEDDNVSVDTNESQESHEKELLIPTKLVCNYSYEAIDFLLENGYIIISYTSSISYKTIKIVLFLSYNWLKWFIGVSGIYLLWIGMHYGASHLYTQWCVPKTFYGFLISPLLTSTPHCQGLRWVVHTGANTINAMWILLGSWICSNIFFMNMNMNMNNSPGVPVTN